MNTRSIKLNLKIHNKSRCVINVDLQNRHELIIRVPKGLQHLEEITLK